MKAKRKNPDPSLMRKIHAGEAVGVFDIGSNSVRFVAYDMSFDPPLPFINRKVTSGLGAELEKSGKLCKKGTRKTLAAIRDFLALAEDLKIARVHAIATAAIREASDGRAFAELLARKNGIDIRILSGEEEAIYAARGVISAFPDARGIVADLGGGSLELALVAGRRVTHPLSMPLGVLRLAAHGDAAPDVISAHLTPAAKILARQTTLFAVGGTWRAFAESFQVSGGIRQPHSHGFEMTAADVAAFSDRLAGLTRAYLVERLAVDKKRATLLPYAALMLAGLTARTGVKTVVFSNAGLRDGLVDALMR